MVNIKEGKLVKYGYEIVDVTEDGKMYLAIDCHELLIPTDAELEIRLPDETVKIKCRLYGFENGKPVYVTSVGKYLDKIKEHANK